MIDVVRAGTTSVDPAANAAAKQRLLSDLRQRGAPDRAFVQELLNALDQLRGGDPAQVRSHPAPPRDSR